MRKKVFLISCVLACSMHAVAQDETSSCSSVTLDGSAYDFIFYWKRNATQAHWTGLGFAFSDLEGLSGVDLKPTQSYSIMLNVSDFIIPMHPHWLFFTGVGLDFSRYHFRGNVGLKGIPATDGSGRYVAAFVPDPAHEYKSSKLLTYYVTIPFMLEYQTRTAKNNLFFINGGVEGLIGYYTKSQVDIRNGDQVEKVSLGRDLGQRPLSGRLALRAGFRQWSLFGYYQLFSLFKDGKGPDVRPCGMGVMLNF
ncbi:MAG: PorT family protein [Tannerella sp.]|nr:PorT family protein [Tannerella sp.]